MMKEMFNSETLPSADRLDAWRDAVSQSLIPVEISTDAPAEFRATLRVVELGVAQVAAMTYSSLQSLRTSKLIRRSDPDLYSVGLVLRGGHGIAQAGRESVPTVSDLVFYTTAKPFDNWMDTHWGTGAILLAQVPQTLLPFPRDTADQLLAIRVSGRQGMGALLAQFLIHLSTDTSPYRPADGPRLGTVLIDLITAAIAHLLDANTAVPPESRKRTLFLRIQAFIRQHLDDPTLSPDAIATAHHISIRQLHRLFHEHGRTVAGWIRQLRLEHCHRDLSDPQLHRAPIHAVAARWGFTDTAHFSRLFRTTYGISATDFRQLTRQHQTRHLQTTAGHSRAMKF